MKRLLLLRHAKSSWSNGGADDFQRPLAPRGVRAAGAMARFLTEHKLVPDRVLCSAARRTVETWNLLADSLGHTATVEIEPGLYLAETTALLERIRAVPDTSAVVMLIGHNPGMETLARVLAGSGDGAAIEQMTTKFPTAGLAVIDFDVAHWSEIARRQGRLERFVTPKELS
jgi:phosphohistidine phosphatase